MSSPVSPRSASQFPFPSVPSSSGTHSTVAAAPVEQHPVPNFGFAPPSANGAQSALPPPPPLQSPRFNTIGTQIRADHNITPTTTSAPAPSCAGSTVSYVTFPCVLLGSMVAGCTLTAGYMGSTMCREADQGKNAVDRLCMRMCCVPVTCVQGCMGCLDPGICTWPGEACDIVQVGADAALTWCCPGGDNTRLGALRAQWATTNITPTEVAMRRAHYPMGGGHHHCHTTYGHHHTGPYFYYAPGSAGPRCPSSDCCPDGSGSCTGVSEACPALNNCCECSANACASGGDAVCRALGALLDCCSKLGECDCNC